MNNARSFVPRPVDESRFFQSVQSGVNAGDLTIAGNAMLLYPLRKTASQWCRPVSADVAGIIPAPRFAAFSLRCSCTSQIMPCINHVLRRKLIVPSVFLTLGKEEDAVGNGAELLAVRARGSLPDDFVAEVMLSEDAVEEEAQVGVGGWIAVEVEAAGFCEQAMAFYQTHRHHHEIGLHLWRMHVAGGGAEMIQFRIALVQQFMLFLADIVHRPVIVKAGLLLGLRSAEAVIEPLLFIEGRIRANQIGATGIQSAHYRQVIPNEHGLILAIEFAHVWMASGELDG